MSPTARTLAHLRRAGFLAVPVERWIPEVNRKADLLRIADVLAIHPRDRIILLVQATTDAHAGDRLARCRARPELAAWLKAGGTFEVHGWELRSGRWEVRRVAVNPADLQPVMLTPPRARRCARKGERQGLLFAEERKRGGAGACGVSRPPPPGLNEGDCNDSERSDRGTGRCSRRGGR